MEIIMRERYLNQLIEFKDNNMVKIITGVRRCGKSILLEMYRNYLLQHGINPRQMITIDFERYDNKDLRIQAKMMEYLKDKIISQDTYYVFIDEVQELEETMKTLNYIRASFANVDLYVTGSNSTIFSGEFATYLAGRYNQIRMYPLSFSEFLIFNKDSKASLDDQYAEYLKYGGFPKVVMGKNHEQKVTILNDILDSILKKDVMIRGRLSNDINLLKVTRFIFDNVGCLTSISNIRNTLISSGVKIALDTIEQYLSLLIQAYLIYPVQRYDIKGKEHLKTNGKYYVIDIGLRNALLGYKDFNVGRVLENVVFQELLMRQYNISAGKIDTKEIDFVTSSFDEYVYYQVSDVFSSAPREWENFRLIADNYPKVLITNESKHGPRSIEGIKVLYITDFLTSR